MTDDEILDEFRSAEALLEGHFILSSGLRSPRYLQCARVLMDGARAERLARALAATIRPDIRAAIDVVVSPAMGGVIIGHEMGRALGKPAIFVERPTGTFELRRGFTIPAGAKVLMVEDVVTTAGSTRETIAVAQQHGATVVGACSIVDRSGGTHGLDLPYAALLPMKLPTYQEAECPLCKQGIPVIKPGSRTPR